MFINNFDPVAISILSFDIRWYSLAYIFGILFGWIYIKRILLQSDEDNRNFDDLISFIIIGIILGGRFGYVLFYNFKYYLNNPLEVFFIWQGGMSFHGGLIGVIICTVLFCKKRKINSFKYLDLISVVAPIGIFFGRLANFINSELYGRVTDVPWSFIFQKVDNFQRHPSQLYEAFFEGIILFIILNILVKLNYLNKSSLISSIFLILYSFFRFIIEFFRAPDSQIGFIFLNITMGQILSLFLFSIGIIIFLKNVK